MYFARKPRTYELHREILIGLLIGLTLAVLLSFHKIWTVLPPSEWFQSIQSTTHPNLNQLVVSEVILPRLVISILAGAALALSGAIFQQILRNPLAEATTLGVGAGAALALKICVLVAPQLADTAQAPVAFSGASLALAITFLIAWRDASSPLRLILAGMVVSLFCSVVSSVLSLFFHEQLKAVFLWSSGSLLNIGWEASAYLAPRLVLCFIAALLLHRPFSVLALSDDNAKSLGISTAGLRVLGMLVATGLAAAVVSVVGMIGFIGIVAPALVRMGGVRTFKGQVIAAPILGAVLLWTADQLTQVNTLFRSELPTGISTAVLGGPLMLWMVARLRTLNGPTSNSIGVDIARRLSHPWGAIIALLPLSIFAVWSALALGQTLNGWHWSDGAQLEFLFNWRWPRVISAAAAGALLALSGTMIQRMMGNPMASPEILGVSSGSALGVVLLFLFGTELTNSLKVLTAALGAFVTLTIMFFLSKRANYSPERMILTGIALGTVLGAVLAIATVGGDPRLGTLLAWMSGSTYAVTHKDALAACVVLSLILIAIPFVVRWMEILSLGDVTARSVGIELARSRLSILIAASVSTGAAVLIVGPLSFVGLMAPHIARLAGFQRALPQLISSALLGALIMVFADWLGRNILFPYQIPAGILATLIGGPYFLWLMWGKVK